MQIAAVRYRDGHIALLYVESEKERELRRAGFRSFAITLRPDDGPAREANLWMQDEPSVTDYLNAALLLFQDAPGSLWWR